MKKIYLSAILALLSLHASATHLMGGEILIHDLNNGQHVVTLLVYRDTVGIPMDLTATFNFSGPNGQSFFTTTPYDSIISGNLLPMYPYGVEIYLFIDTVSLPAQGMWEVYWEDCCRNGAIQNLSAPLSERMILKTSLMVDSVPNSTPFFIVPAAIFLPLQTPWQYNPLPFDPDGDSLHWRLDTPLTRVNQYCAGYSDPSSDPSNPFSIDPITGTISWTANNMGNFVASILVDQFRNGQWVGSIRRDMQFIVVNPGLGFPQWTGLSNFNKDSLGHYTFDLVAGEEFKLNLWAQHSNAQRVDDLDMGAFSEIFLDASKQANFSVYRNRLSKRIQGIFSWKPGIHDIRDEAYLVSFRVSDGYFTDDKTFRLKVNTAVDNEELGTRNDLAIYPNPADDMIFIELQSDASENNRLRLFDITGREVLTARSWTLRRGANRMALSTSQLHTGIYFLQITDESGMSTTRSISVEH
jgi:hypothetical protein